MTRRSEELTEIARRFRGKLRELRERDLRNQRRQGKRSRTARCQARLECVESSPADEVLLSSGELAELLNVRPTTVWRWATYEGLPAVRTLGGHRRYRWADVRAWIVRDANGGTPSPEPPPSVSG
jgi:excisionase family DNA binding protein